MVSAYPKPCYEHGYVSPFPRSSIAPLSELTRRLGSPPIAPLILLVGRRLYQEGMGEGEGLRGRMAAGELSQFRLTALEIGEVGHGDRRAFPLYGFFHPVMGISEGGDQRLMGDAEDLMVQAQIVQLVGDRLGHLPRYPRINFIKNQRRRPRRCAGETGF